MISRNKGARASGHDNGSKEGGGGCSSLRVRGWWMLTMNSQGVEICIAGCVEEIVRDLNPRPFFSFFFLLLFFSFHVLCIINY